jgi:hypothetical protein
VGLHFQIEKYETQVMANWMIKVKLVNQLLTIKDMKMGQINFDSIKWYNVENNFSRVTNFPLKALESKSVWKNYELAK